MPLDGALVIRVTDIYGQAVAEPADLLVSRRDGRAVFQQAAMDCRAPVKIAGLDQGPGAVFMVRVEAPSYYPVNNFASVAAGGAEARIVLPFRHEAVRSIRFPEFGSLPAEAQALIGAERYLALDNERKSGLLNIIAKCEQTILPQGGSVLSMLTRLLRFERDRIFAEVSGGLTAAARLAASLGRMREVSSGLHPVPTGYTRGASYKTRDRFGNLQITLFHRTGEPSIADIDIDDAAGLKHVFQVIGNAFRGPTHPYDIQAVLIATQRLDTRYTLVAG